MELSIFSSLYNSVYNLFASKGLLFNVNKQTMTSTIPTSNLYKGGYAIANNILYTFAGWFMSYCYKYDPISDTWTYITSYPGGNADYLTVVKISDTQIFCTGGGYYLTNTYIFDTTTNTFTQKANCIYGLSKSAGVYTPDGFIYVFGGYQKDLTTGTVSLSNRILRYNILTDTWEEYDTLPFSTYCMTAVYANGKIILGPSSGSPYFYEYDPITKTTTQITQTINRTDYAFTYDPINNWYVIYGGYITTTSSLYPSFQIGYVDDISILDLNSGKFYIVDFPKERGIVGACIGYVPSVNKFVFAGGFDYAAYQSITSTTMVTIEKLL